jgi:hypothetical protein
LRAFVWTSPEHFARGAWEVELKLDVARNYREQRQIYPREGYPDLAEWTRRRLVGRGTWVTSVEAGDR